MLVGMAALMLVAVVWPLVVLVVMSSADRHGGLPGDRVASPTGRAGVGPVRPSTARQAVDPPGGGRRTQGPSAHERPAIRHGGQ